MIATNKYQLRLALHLLTPSLSSATLVVIGAVIGLAIPAWSFLEDSQPLFEFFYGTQGLVTTLQNSSAGSQAVWDSLFTLPIAYNVTIVLFALAIGGVTFLILQLINRISAGVASLSSIRFEQPSFRKTVKREIEARLAVRTIAALLWLAYCFVSTSVLWPFCILCIRTSVGQFPLLEGWKYFALGSGLFVLVLHMHIVCIRLIALRPRLFGNPTIVYN